MRYDRRAIMRKAHENFRSGRYGSFANCLHLAWVDAKVVACVHDEHGDVKTWYGWTLVGREVIHDEHAVAQVTVTDHKTKKGTRVLSFFTYEQTVELGTQPEKVA